VPDVPNKRCKYMDAYLAHQKFKNAKVSKNDGEDLSLLK
jgi:hypothetical protein